MDEMTVSGLSPRQEQFCTHYALHGNGAEAARQAGYSVAAARQEAHRLLTNADILARVAQLQAEWHAQQISALRAHVGPAVEILAEIASGKAEPKGAQARVLACTALLDRAGFQPIQRVETNAQTAVIVQVSRDDMDL